MEYPFVVIELSEDLESKDIKINMKQGINVPMKGSWIMKIVIVRVPSSFYPTLEPRDKILV